MIQKHLCSCMLELSWSPSGEQMFSFAFTLNSIHWLSRPGWTLFTEMDASCNSLSVLGSWGRICICMIGGCTISNPANTCVDSPHTSDLSPPTQFHSHLAIKVRVLCCFGLLLLSRCFMGWKGSCGGRIALMNEPRCSVMHGRALSFYREQCSNI